MVRLLWCLRHGLLGLAFASVALLVVPTPARAVDLPGLPDCRESPVPELPGNGLAGYFAAPPDQLPPEGDPFAAGSSTSILEQYGYAGLRWNTYDLGCGPEVARNPDAAAGTAIANWIYNLPKTAVAATNSIVDVAFEPTFLQIFDPLVERASSTLYETVFAAWVPVTLAAVGFMLLLRARRAALASSAAAVAWALLVLVVASALFQWPLQAGRAADSSVTATLGAVSTGLIGDAAAGSSGPGERAGANLHESLLYRTWLAGTFGQANGETARRHGAAIFDAQALTWLEAAALREDRERGQEIIEGKQAKFEETADKVKAEDPDAYAYLTGKRSDTRVGYATLAGVAVLCALPFLFVAALLVLAAFLIVRFAVMLFPVFATLGVFPTMRGVVLGVGNTVAAALINSVLFGVGAALTVGGIALLLDPASALPDWLALVLMLVFSIVMWIATKPFRRLTKMVSPRSNVFGDAAGGVGTASSSGWQRAKGLASTAAGSFIGNATADRLEEHRYRDDERARRRQTRAEGRPDEPTVPSQETATGGPTPQVWVTRGESWAATDGVTASRAARSAALGALPLVAQAPGNGTAGQPESREAGNGGPVVRPALPGASSRTEPSPNGRPVVRRAEEGHHEPSSAGASDVYVPGGANQFVGERRDAPTALEPDLVDGDEVYQLYRPDVARVSE